MPYRIQEVEEHRVPTNLRKAETLRQQETNFIYMVFHPYRLPFVIHDSFPGRIRTVGLV